MIYPKEESSGEINKMLGKYKKSTCTSDGVMLQYNPSFWPKARRENEPKAKFEQSARSFFEFSERECSARSVSLMKRTSLIIDKKLYAEKGG